MLTPQKMRFAQALMRGLKGKAAAIDAGCPAKTAACQASRYMKDDDIQDFIMRATIEHKGHTGAQSMDNAPPCIPKQADDPVEFFKNVMNDMTADPKLRLDAAKELARYTVAKPGEATKKESKQEAAEKIAKGGKFGASVSPRLVRDNTR
jgi:phage terminase small subunit